MKIMRSWLHLLWMAITVMPWGIAVVVYSFFGSSAKTYWLAVGWLRLAMRSGQWLLGIKHEYIGLENLPNDPKKRVILLIKHQSTWETLCMPPLMTHQLALVFKRELLFVPFFGWAMSRLDMIHIDRRQRAQAFNKVVEQGQAILDRGIWIAMFPEGTRIPRGQKGVYKQGGTRLACATGAAVIPVAVTSAKCWPRKAWIKSSGTVEFSFGPLIDSAGHTPATLMKEVETWIENEMQRLDPAAYH